MIRLLGTPRARHLYLSLGLAVAACLALVPAARSQSAGGGAAGIEVQTVPRLPKIRLSFEGRHFRTDRRGRAVVRGAGSKTEVQRKLAVLNTVIRPGVRARFGGWHRGRVVLVIDYLVRPRFVDIRDNPVDPSRIESVVLKNGYGLPERFDSASLGWLPGKGLLASGDTLSRKPVLHTVMRVVVDGSSVVNRGQQRFFPARDPEPRIELLFFSARLRSRDALFGFPLGSALKIRYPNGRTEQIKLEDGAELTLPSLPRGRYEVDTVGPGISFSRPLDLSRDQDLKLEVISWFDVVAVLLLAAVVLLGLLLIGRPQLARRLPLIGPRLSRRLRLDSRV